jgi:peptide-methionine (R)-S-oxide reductase
MAGAFVTAPLLPALRAARAVRCLAFTTAHPVSAGSFVTAPCHLARRAAQPLSVRPLRMMADTTTDLPKPVKEMTDNDWKEVLKPDEFQVLRKKGTEPATTGEYDGFYPTEGHFVCRACKAPLYSAESKFKSGCGWPAFDQCYKGAVNTITDTSFGMRRVEILCANCDGHLGHVFEGERMTPTNERHCVNSVREHRTLTLLLFS